MMREEIRIVLADDHRLFADGLQALLSKEADMTVAAVATSGSEAVKLAGDLRPHVVVMDVSMPDLNGLEATRRIVAANPASRVLCLSMHSDEKFVSSALQCGASGYLLKEAALDELVRAVRCVAAGQTYLSPAVAGAAVSALRSGRSPETPTDTLTGRELEVLQLIAEGHATAEIATRLHVSVKTIATHRANIMDKLGIHGVAALTKYAIRQGIVSLGDGAHREAPPGPDDAS